MGSGTASEDAGSEAVGANVDRPVYAAMNSGTASEEAGSEAGVPTRTSPAAPSSLSHAPPTMVKFWFKHPFEKIRQAQIWLRDMKFHCDPHETPSQTRKFGVMFGLGQNKNGK